MTELFQAKLLRSWFCEYPGKAGLANSSLTFDELRSLGSIEAAERQLMEKKLEGIMRGSLEDRLEYFSESLGLNFGYLSDDDSARLTELHERRNLIVHNGGRVNTIYLANVPECLTEHLSEGDQLTTDEDYLEDAIDLCERIMLLMAADLWKRHDKTDSMRGDTLGILAFESLKAKRWRIAEALSKFMMRDRAFKESTILGGQMNFWLAKKRQGKFEEVEADIKKADLSAKSPRFRLAKAALLDDFESCAGWIGQAYSSGDMSSEDIWEWPLLEAFRESDAFRELIDELKIKKPTKLRQLDLKRLTEKLGEQVGVADEAEPDLEQEPEPNLEVEALAEEE
jgi:hypothetical protein